MRWTQDVACTILNKVFTSFQCRPGKVAMSSKKQNRRQRRGRREAQQTSGSFTASRIFILLIILAAVTVGVVAYMDSGQPVDCPPGQVWSDDHNHCH
jgi:hypothetical protein